MVAKHRDQLTAKWLLNPSARACNALQLFPLGRLVAIFLQGRFRGARKIAHPSAVFPRQPDDDVPLSSPADNRCAVRSGFLRETFGIGQRFQLSHSPAAANRIAGRDTIPE